MQINVMPPEADTAENWAKYIKLIWEDKDNTKRKNDSKIVVDFYKYKQAKYLEEELRKIFSDPIARSFKRRWSHNYTKQIIDSLAQCYNSRVRREINENISDALYKEIDRIIFSGLNKSMAVVNKWLILERTALVFARWSEKDKSIQYKSFNQFQFDLVFRETSDGKELSAVILSDYREFSESIIYVYTENNLYKFKGNKLLQINNHNIGILPFTVIYSEDPSFEDYLDPLIELANANLELNLAEANLLNILQNQAHGLLVLKTPAEHNTPGDDDSDPNNVSPESQEVDRRLALHDPSKLIELTFGEDGQEPSLESIPHNADFTGAIDTIRFLANSLANSMGLDHGVFEVQVSTNPATVFHINEKRRQAIIGDYQAIFVDAEKDLFEKAYALARKTTISLPLIRRQDLKIEFSPEQTMIDKMDSKDVLSLRDSGVIDTIEVIKQHYPTLNRREATIFLKKMIKSEKKTQKLLSELKQEENKEESQGNQNNPEINNQTV